MTAYAVSFRIADVSTHLGSYSVRWSSVDAAIQSQANGRLYWKQTTSFFVLDSNQISSGALASAIDNNSKFDRAQDLLLVINLSEKGYAVLGQNSDTDLDAIMQKR